MKTLQIPYVTDLSDDCSLYILSKLRSTGSKINIDSVNWPESYPDNRKTDVFCFHDGKRLFLLFDCEGNDIMAKVAEDLGPVAGDSCVEFFVSPDPASPVYWNFEFNAIGRKNVSTRSVRNNPRRLSPEELAQIRIITSEGSTPFEEKRGFHKWWLLAVIPLELIGIHYEGQPIEMKANFYKCAANTSSPHYLSWAPIDTEKPDFHRTDFFAKIILS